MKLSVFELERREVPVAPFTLAMLPDTQFYSQSYPETFNAQTQWIVDNKAAQNIVFVAHQGDIVQSGENGANQNATQWARADAAMDLLDGVVPYGTCLGNHDYGQVSVREAGHARYSQYFGPDRYRSYSWYGGADEQGVNHYQYFSGGGRIFMHFSFEWEPTDADIAWAQTVINANPGIPTIISTHSYLNDTHPGREPLPVSSDGNSGEQLFQKFVKPNSQIFMVLSGHFSGEYSQVSLNNAGRPVYEMVADYQSRVNGGDGWMRLIQFEPDFNRISVKTYSPTLNQFETDSNSQFSYTLNFNALFGPVTVPPPAGPIVTSTFRFGEAGYTGTVDTQVRQNAATTAYGTKTTDLFIDYPDNANAAQALVRFDSIIGSGAKQVPPNAVILNAELILQTTNAGDGANLHRMAKAFSPNDTWNSLTNGLSANNVEARIVYESAVGDVDNDPNVPLGQTRINVTRDVQDWASGASNHGWAFLPRQDATDGWGFAPSEVVDIAQRPQLRIEWTLPGSTLASYQQGSNYAGTVDTNLAANTPTTPQGASQLVVVDGPADGTTRHALLRFDAIFGTAPGQIPPGARIQWARLYLTTPYINDNADGGGAALHRVLQPWTNSATWQNSFGGNGVQTNNLEAAANREMNTGSVSFGSQGFDVTSTLRAWRGGAPNYGWLFQPNTDDAWMFASAERSLPGERPRLVVSWQAFSVDALPGVAVDFTIKQIGKLRVLEL